MLDGYRVSFERNRTLVGALFVHIRHPHRGPRDTEVYPDSHKEKQVQCSEVSTDNDCV